MFTSKQIFSVLSTTYFAIADHKNREISAHFGQEKFFAVAHVLTGFGEPDFWSYSGGSGDAIDHTDQRLQKANMAWPQHQDETPTIQPYPYQNGVDRS